MSNISSWTILLQFQHIYQMLKTLCKHKLTLFLAAQPVQNNSEHLCSSHSLLNDLHCMQYQLEKLDDTPQVAYSVTLHHTPLHTTKQKGSAQDQSSVLQLSDTLNLNACMLPCQKLWYWKLATFLKISLIHTLYCRYTIPTSSYFSVMRMSGFLHTMGST